MNLEQIQTELKDYAKDIRLNLSKVLSEEGSPGLSQEQIYGVALASACTTKHPGLITAILERVQTVLSPQAVNAAKGAAVIMAMNNIYYRFAHTAQDTSYRAMPANLRMNLISNPGVSLVDFELYSLAVSSMNGCGFCMNAHVHAVSKSGITPLGIQSSVRIAAVISALAQALTSG